MNKIKKILIGFGIIFTTILVGSGYQYLDHKEVFVKHKNGLIYNNVKKIETMSPEEHFKKHTKN